MYEPAYVKVTAPGQARDHIAKLVQFFDGTGKALCGVKPFPDKWEELMPSAGFTPCPGCVQKLRSAGVRIR
ncbi:hypothetical protein [Streptomyces sp. I8-5]|uniref:hypothetical protein n=1 Tax=Streptomyces sp. I8-5 TaxID=3104277 RepID=UPI00386B2869